MLLSGTVISSFTAGTHLTLRSQLTIHGRRRSLPSRCALARTAARTAVQLTTAVLPLQTKLIAVFVCVTVFTIVIVIMIVPAIPALLRLRDIEGAVHRGLQRAVQIAVILFPLL